MKAPRGVVLILACATAAHGADPISFSGPAMGTTYRVTLAEPIAGLPAGLVHREVDRLLARLDRGLSTWRADSDATRLNQAAAGTWIGIGPDLADVLVVARGVHDESGGAFDVTAGPLVRLLHDGPEPAAAWLGDVRKRVGLQLLDMRQADADRPAAVRKLVDGVELDLGGIGPGYAVDCIGERLAELGSANHLVELGGEVRAWGSRSAAEPWRVRLRGPGDGNQELELQSGTALATATSAAGRTIVDPRTGRMIAGPARSRTVRADTCCRADAWAVAAVVLDLQPDADGLVSVPAAPSTKAAPPAATRAAP